MADAETSHAVAVTVAGAAEAQARLLETVSGLTDAVARQPSLLPDWSVGHVLTHLARNADGNTWMLEGALVGEIRLQYPGGAAQRAGDIEAGAGRPADELVADLEAACERLAATWAAMDDDAWQRSGRNLRGEVPARHMPYGRWREVEVHHADLGLGFGWGHWSGEFVDLELERLVASLPRRLEVEHVSVVRLIATDTGATWTVAPETGNPRSGEDVPASGEDVPASGEDVTLVEAPKRRLAAWLLGRSHEPDFPAVRPWE